MIQTQFWNSIWDDLEIGWWIDFKLQKMIQMYPNSIITVFTETGIPVCGYIHNEHNGQEIQMMIPQLKDGTLLHEKVHHEKFNL